MINDLSTFLGSKAATAVEIDGLFVPVNSAPKFLQTYSAPALFYNPEFPDFELSRRGTLTKCHFQGRYFALVTAHQTSDFDLEQLAIHENVGTSVTTSNSCTFSKSKKTGEESHFDCRLYDFSDPVNKGAMPSIGWLRFKDDWFSDLKTDPDLVFTIGFPTEINDLDYDAKHMHTAPYAAFGQPQKQALPNRHAFSFNPKLNFCPDGLSGSPVYGFFVDASGVSFKLLGMLTNASQKTGNFLSMKNIARFLKKALIDT